MEFLEFDVRLRMNSASIKFLLDYIDITDITVLQSLDMRQKERLQHHRRLLHFLGLSNIWSPAWTEENQVSIAGIPKNTDQYLSRTNVTSMSWNILCGTTLPAQTLPSECMITSCECACLLKFTATCLGEVCRPERWWHDRRNHWRKPKRLRQSRPAGALAIGPLWNHLNVPSYTSKTDPFQSLQHGWRLFATQVAYSAVGIPQDLNIVEIWYTPSRCIFKHNNQTLEQKISENRDLALGSNGIVFANKRNEQRGHWE